MKEFINNLERFSPFFQGFQHNRPVIYSTITGQYDGVVYLDDEEEMAILVTKFDYMFVGGECRQPRAEEFVHDVIFNHLVKKEHYKEIILFGPDECWNEVLSNVFNIHHGVLDGRLCFKLNKEKFKEKANDVQSTDGALLLETEDENNSKISYPVANYYIENEKISFCSAFMITEQYAEIDVGTNEAYRNRGYAKQAAFMLIQHLITQGIEPNWCTWPYRKESQMLAISIGFELEQEVAAHIWVEDFGL